MQDLKSCIVRSLLVCYLPPVSSTCQAGNEYFLKVDSANKLPAKPAASGEAEGFGMSRRRVEGLNRLMHVIPTASKYR